MDGGPTGYQKGRFLRQTLYGKLRQGFHTLSGTPVVIKEYLKHLVETKTSTSGEPVAEDAKQEIAVHARLSQKPHPYLVQLYQVQEDATKIYTIQELCEGGELYGYVETQPFSPDLACHFFCQLMEGVHHIHSQGFAHRDLSLENLLLAKEVLKICDFGVSIPSTVNTVLHETDPNRRVGKLAYMAPEVFACQPYNPLQADVWCCGVILFLMLCRAFPYELPTPVDQRFIWLMAGNISAILQLYGKSLSPDVIHLLQHMLCPASSRFTTAQVLSHHWLTNYKKSRLAAAAATSSSSTSTSSEGSFSSEPACANLFEQKSGGSA